MQPNLLSLCQRFLVDIPEEDKAVSKIEDALFKKENGVYAIVYLKSSGGLFSVEIEGELKSKRPNGTVGHNMVTRRDAFISAVEGYFTEYDEDSNKILEGQNEN